MRKLMIAPAVIGALLLGAPQAHALCDSIDGPAASAALEALESGNVNLVLPYAPEEMAPEIRDAFEQVVEVRAAGGEAKRLADRHFIETVVRLHRTGEGAPYTGLMAAGADLGPIIPAAERALETGDTQALETLLVDEIRQAVERRFEHASAAQTASKRPHMPAEVAAARERVNAGFDFVRYVEGVHRAIEGEGEHAE